MNSPEDFRYMPEQLKGLVAHWDSSGGRSGIMKIAGLYMSRAGMRRDSISKSLNPARQGKGVKQIVSLDTLIAILFQKIKENAAAGHRVSRGNERSGRIRPYSEFNRIRHGPQADYIHYIQAHRREEMNPELMKIDLPAAMCEKTGR